MSNARKQLEAWLKTIEIDSCSVADVGGLAMPIHGRTKIWKPSLYKIFDKSYGADVIFNLDEYIDADALGEKERYDVVFCLEVFEYLWNPFCALVDISGLMKKNGVLYISFHTMFPHHHPRDTDCLRYTKTGIQRLLEHSGFKMVEIVPRMAVDRESLEKFCTAESKMDYAPGVIGYLVKATKI